MSTLVTIVDPSTYMSLEKSAKVVINKIYSVKINNSEYLQSLSRSPIVLLPKHQLFLDILIEGMILDQYQQRNGFFVMKDSLPAFLSKCGGIRIKRLKDLDKNASPKERKIALHEAQKQKKEVHYAMEKVLKYNGALVVHPEGSRNYNRIGKIDRTLLGAILKVQEKIPNPVAFIPLSINYLGTPYLPGMKIIVDIAKPLYTNKKEELENYLLKSLPLVE
jgi:1-acyl-sn-glycerol-3-phosphate acyltransferase